MSRAENSQIAKNMPVSTRHKWGDKLRFPLKTEQSCVRCDMVKVGRHECPAGMDIYWDEFWRDGDRIFCGATPPCDARLETRASAPETAVELPYEHGGLDGH